MPEFLLDVPVPGAESEDMRAALDDLAAYSLSRRATRCGRFLVHRLVQDVTRRGLDEAGSATARLTEALGWVNAAFDGDPAGRAQLAPASIRWPLTPERG